MYDNEIGLSLYSHNRLFICRSFTDLYKTIRKCHEFTPILRNSMLDNIVIGETLVRQLRRYEILEHGTLSSKSDHLHVPRFNVNVTIVTLMYLLF
jgi:hypothetical protein